MIESVPSPCVRNCCLDHEDVCMGCYRTMAEIMSWNRATITEKQAILDAVQDRKKNAPKPSLWQRIQLR